MTLGEQPFMDLKWILILNLEYTDKNGEKKLCAVIHRAPLGSHERFIGFLIEHFGGAFPAWLAPLQIKVIPITENQAEYAKSITENLKAVGLRAETDDRNESMQSKIRDAQIFKVPYMLVVGKREQEASKVSVRLRTGEDLGAMKVDATINKIKEK